MITTNIAPQWQLFNAGNWLKLEEALRSYTTQTQNSLYVITGTSKYQRKKRALFGDLRFLIGGTYILLV